MKVDFGDFSFMRIEPKVVRFVSGVATAFLGSGGFFPTSSSLCNPVYMILLIFICFCSESTFLEFSKEEYQTAKVDPIAQFAKPVTVYVNYIIS